MRTLKQVEPCHHRGGGATAKRAID